MYVKNVRTFLTPLKGLAEGQLLVFSLILPRLLYGVQEEPIRRCQENHQRP